MYGNEVAIDADGSLTNSGSFSNTGNSSIFVTKNMQIESTGDFMNEDGLIAIGGAATLAQSISITKMPWAERMVRC